LSSSEFIAVYFSILDGLLQSGDQVQAQQLYSDSKILSKNVIAFSTPPILQFSDQSHKERQLTTMTPVSMTSKLTISIDCSVVKAPKIT